MTDRELLEAAARAAGVNVRLVSWAMGPKAFDGHAYRIEGTQTHWNPLTDDGDALRLAVALDLTVMIGAVRDCAGNLSLDPADNNLTATRRAIVRAAAAMAPTPATPPAP